MSLKRVSVGQKQLLENQGVRLLRFSHDQVFNCAAYVFRRIEEALKEIAPSPPILEER